MSQLNPQQQQAVRYIDGPLLVLAGAGSGKTSVITRKIAYLVEQCGIPAYHIAAVTFTNKAAQEMRERVAKLISGDLGQGLMVSTFHTLGLNIIRREHRRLGLKPGFSIMDGEDSAAILKDILLADGIPTEQAQLFQSLISTWKNELVNPVEAMALAKSGGEQHVAKAYEQYQRLLRAYNAVDFDDLIMQPARLFAEQAEVLDHWQQKIRYLLVDEYQDTNGAQYQLVNLLVGGRKGLTVVGDDDQSIYAWRGAKPENLDLLSKDYPTLKVIKLEQNYRSTSRILKAANTVIANNPHVIDKKLWSELGHGEAIRVISCENDDAELERVAAEIHDQKLRYRRKFGDFAILYRGNFQARALEIKLQQGQIPYQVSGGTSFFGRNEVKDIMAYLRLLNNPDDDNAFLRIINTPRRKIGPSTLEALGHYAHKRNASLYRCSGELGLTQHMPEQGAIKLREFASWLEGIRKLAGQDDPIGAVRSMIHDMGYQSWQLQNAGNPQSAERRMQNVWTLVDALKDNMETRGDDTLQEAISRLVLRDMLDQQDDEQETDKVQLMTLHASKGLEFPHAFIIGMEENLLPHRASIDEGNIEEERRLCYVGITRAQRSLTITLAKRRKQFGEHITTTPSRFLDEFPEDAITREGFGEFCPEQNQARGNETLSSLKDLFS
ncbi:MAG: DNA helicase Rep [Pseudomonadales bacterium]